jgi:hypothetical protein
MPRLPIDYSHRLQDLRTQRGENPYIFVRFQGVDESFWSQFHSDYYNSILYQDGKHGTKPPLFIHKYMVLKKLREHQNAEVDAMLAKLDELRILPLMTFQYDWNEEILCQF